MNLTVNSFSTLDENCEKQVLLSLDPIQIFIPAVDGNCEENVSQADDCCKLDFDNESREALSEIPVEVVMKNQKNEQASKEQKELMMEFIQENPELVTHSSTPENEKNLWEDLTNKLNDLKPEKTLENWKHVWYRWQNKVFKNSETRLQCLDMKLKKFLKLLRSDSEGKMVTISKTKPKKRLNVEEIESILKDIEKEKYTLHLEIDENEVKILKFKSIVRALEGENITKHKRMRKLNERKIYLNSKKRKIQESEAESIEVLQKQLMDIEKELAES